jgi:hypothetical protein
MGTLLGVIILLFGCAGWTIIGLEIWGVGDDFIHSWIIPSTRELVMGWIFRLLSILWISGGALFLFALIYTNGAILKG